MKSVNSWLPNWFRVLSQKYFDKARLTKKKELLLGLCLFSEWCHFDRWWLFWISWRSVTLCNSPGIWTGQNISPINSWTCGDRKLWIKILHVTGFLLRNDLIGQGHPSPLCKKRWDGRFPYRTQDCNSFSIRFYCIFSTIKKLENYFALLYLWIFCSV